jgi:hypothetical protein
MWIGVGDLILISLRDFEDGKADVLHKYSTEEARSLQVATSVESTNEHAQILFLTNFDVSFPGFW